MTLIKVENLTKIFGSNARSVLQRLNKGMSKAEILKSTGHTVGVNNVSFEVQEGEIFVIMGLSGSGKSTLIRCLNLLNRPTSGKIYIADDDITTYDTTALRDFRQKKIAMVFQHFGLFTHRSIVSNVEYGLEIRGMDKEERRAKAIETLEMVGLEGYAEQFPDQLSGGMQQRVGLARALANDPEILLMDEPFSALDPLNRRELQLELLNIQSELKKTIIFITHDVNEAFKLGDRVAVMKDGTIEQIGTPEEILSEPSSSYIEDFVQDIDRSKVRQAKHVMRKPVSTVYLNGGLKLAIKVMEENGISSVFVVDRDRKLQGLITIDDAIAAVKDGRSLADIVQQSFHKADPETYIQDLIDKGIETRYPIAITDENEKLVGIVVRASILSGLI